jgi:hypothetical protein
MLLRMDWQIVTDILKGRSAFETSITIYQSTRRNNPQDLNFSNTAVRIQVVNVTYNLAKLKVNYPCLRHEGI